MTKWKHFGTFLSLLMTLYIVEEKRNKDTNCDCDPYPLQEDRKRERNREGALEEDRFRSFYWPCSFPLQDCNNEGGSFYLYNYLHP